MLVMVIQVNPTIDKVLYYLVLKVQASVCLRFLFFKSRKMNWLAMTRTMNGLRFVSHGMGL